MANSEGKVTEVKSFKECCSNCGHVMAKKYTVRYRVNQKHTLKSGYIPEYTVETDGDISAEQYFEVVTDFEVLLEKQYPHIKVIGNGVTVPNPENTGI